MKYAYLVWTNLRREGEQDQKHVLGVHTSKKSAMAHYVSVFEYWKCTSAVLEKTAMPEDPESFTTVAVRNLGGCFLVLCAYGAGDKATLELWVERHLVRREEKKK